MHKSNLVIRKDIADQLHKIGFVMLLGWRSEEKTISFARLLGTVVDIKTLLPESDFSTIQTVGPGHKTEPSSYTYTCTYGPGEYPVDTDLAHWARLPRYLTTCVPETLLCGFPMPCLRL